MLEPKLESLPDLQLDAAAADRIPLAATRLEGEPRRGTVVSALLTLLFAATLMAGATLLFLVQPMIAKMTLPLLGGTPAVWNTCMVFFQALLLAGYLYAHLLSRFLTVRRQALVHAAVLLLPLLSLPIAIGRDWVPPGEASPIPWLLGLLAVAVGLPFFVVSTTAPLLQKWFSQTGSRSARDPYFLYAASNLGSLAALLAYPWLLEPTYRLAEQSEGWALGYVAFAWLALLCVPASWFLADHRPAAAPAPDHDNLMTGAARPTLAPVRWVFLACLPSSLLLGVTTYVSTDIASIPLLWVIPLGLYLLTFIVAFSGWSPRIHASVVRLAPLLALVLLFTMVSGIKPSLEMAIGLHLGVFTVVALACHGELARTRPPARYLTGFYLWLSLGGVLGGLINAVAAPLLLVNVLEYPLALALACLLLPAAARQENTLGFWALSRFCVGLMLSVIAVSFLARGTLEFALSFPGLPFDELYREASAFLSVWVNLCLLNTNGLSAALGVPAAVFETALCGLLAAAALLYVFQRVSGRGERAMDLWLPAALGVFAIGCVSISGVNLDNVFRIDGGIGSVGELLHRLVAFGAPPLLLVLFLHRPVRFALGLIALLLGSTFCEFLSGTVIHRERSFYGVHTVQRNPYDQTMQLTHGTTLHGKQFMEPKLRREPLTYYHRTGPIGQVFEAVHAGGRKPRVGVVGLGTGTQAAYGRSGQAFTFYEIDPAVVSIAENPRYFTFLADARRRGVDLKIVLGDARIRLTEAPDHSFDLLVVDAFSSDAIPAHLLTKEALLLYRKKLAPGGVLAFHISNRYLDLEPVLGNLASHLGMVGVHQHDLDMTAPGKSSSIWVALARAPEDLAALKEKHGERWRPLRNDPNLSLWTDDFHNLWEIRK
jgi:spermidine synthase